MRAPDAIAALQRLGRMDLEQRARPDLWLPDRRLRRAPPLWLPPPPVRRDPLLGVTKDATSGAFLPQNASECTTFFGNIGWANPNHLYLFQEASGSILDKIGSSDLAAAGSPTYAQTVTGWSAKSLKFTDATNNQRVKSTAIANVGTTSVLALAFIRTNVTPAAIRGFMTIGTGSNHQKFSLTTTPRWRLDENGAVTATDTATVPSTVQCFVLKHDHTNSLAKGYITGAASILVGTFSASVTGNEFCLGSVDNGTVATIGMDVLFCAIWTGSNAEKGDSDIKNAMVSLGNGLWTPTSWPVSYARGPADTLNAPTDSVARVFVGLRGIAETDPTVTDAVARAFSGARGISETDPTATDAVARRFTGARSLAETDPTVADAVARAFAGSRSLTETDPTPSDAVARTYGSARAVSETAPTPTDAISRAFAGSRGVADSTPAPTDAVAHQSVATRSIGESAPAPTDAIARSFAGARAASESVDAPTDSPSRSQGVSRGVTDAVPAPTDAVASVRGMSRSLTETIPGPIDSASRVYGGVRGPIESTSPPADRWLHKQTSSLGSAMICDEGAADVLGNEGAAAPIGNEGSASAITNEGAADVMPNEGAAAAIADEGDANSQC